MAWRFVGKYEEVILALLFQGKLHCMKNINVKKKNLVQMRPLTAEIKSNN